MVPFSVCSTLLFLTSAHPLLFPLDRLAGHLQNVFQPLNPGIPPVRLPVCSGTFLSALSSSDSRYVLWFHRQTRYSQFRKSQTFYLLIPWLVLLYSTVKFDIVGSLEVLWDVVPDLA